MDNLMIFNIVAAATAKEKDLKVAESKELSADEIAAVEEKMAAEAAASDAEAATETVVAEDAAAVDAVANEEVAVEGEVAVDTAVEGELIVGDGMVVDGGYTEPVMTEDGMFIDPMMEAGMTEVKDPLLASWPFVIGISGAVLFVSVALGAFLARRKIKKGIELYED